MAGDDESSADFNTFVLLVFYFPFPLVLFSDKKEMRELVVFIPILIDIIYSSFIHSHAHVSMSLGFIAIMTLLLLYIRFVFLFEYCGDDLI
jgi:hypothetical protein